MKSVFIDANVVVDFCQQRPDFFRAASIIIDLAVKKKIVLVVSAIMFVYCVSMLKKRRYVLV